MTDPLQSAYMAQSPTNPIPIQSPPSTASSSPLIQLLPPSTSPTLTSTVGSTPPLSMLSGGGLPSPALTPSSSLPSNTSGMMVQLLPASSPPAASQTGPTLPAHHSRSQSTIVPMHSPGGSLLNGNQNVSELLGLQGGTPQNGSSVLNAARGSQIVHSNTIGPAGILATPHGNSVTNLTSPTSVDYAYPVTADGYDVYAEIGSGAFSNVYRGQVKETGEDVAIKVIDLDLFNTNWDEIRREIMIMSQLSHPNVVKLKTAFVDGQDLWIVMSLLTAGSCASVMKELFDGNGLKDEVMVATILREVLQALAYFHKHGSIHRDVKAGNILISGTGDVQLADFGVAGTLMEGGDRKRNRSTFTGTPCWMAPEVMEHNEGDGYDEKADVWSFGITAMELGYGRAPYAKFPPMKVMLLTLQEEPPTCAIYKDTSGYEFSKHYHNMISKCLRRDPKKRPTVRKLLEHKFFQKAADSKYLYEHLVMKLPHKAVSMEKIHIRKGKAGHGGEAENVGGNEAVASEAAYSNTATRAAPHPGAGVKLGSWVFDEDEIETFKSTEGANSLDLLTGTLQHQHTLPHHHTPGGETIPEASGQTDEEEEYESAEPPARVNLSPAPVPIAQQQQPAQPQQQPQQQQPPKITPPVEPTDFFAGILAPAVDLHQHDHDHLSPSAAFAAASSGRMSPSAAFAASATAGRISPLPSPKNGPRLPISSTSTPVLSSIQGKTRQFVVSDHEEVEHTTQSIPSSSPNVTKASTIDLLSDDFDLHQLSTNIPSNQPSASEQFLAAAHHHKTPTLESASALAASDAFNATSNPNAILPDSSTTTSAIERTTSPLNLDVLSITPGSATSAYAAYLASMAEPTPPPTTASVSPVVGSTQPAGVSNRAPISKGNSPNARPIAVTSSIPVELAKGSSPIARPFNSKRASGPLSSLLPVQMPIFRPQPAKDQNTSPPTNRTHTLANTNANNTSPIDDLLTNASIFSPASNSGSTAAPDMSHLHLNINSPPGTITTLQHDSAQSSTDDAQHRQVGRFQVMSTSNNDKE